jgi:hypothetical protein
MQKRRGERTGRFRGTGCLRGRRCLHGRRGRRPGLYGRRLGRRRLRFFGEGLCDFAFASILIRRRRFRQPHGKGRLGRRSVGLRQFRRACLGPGSLGKAGFGRLLFP